MLSGLDWFHLFRQIQSFLQLLLHRAAENQEFHYVFARVRSSSGFHTFHVWICNEISFCMSLRRIPFANLIPMRSYCKSGRNRSALQSRWQRVCIDNRFAAHFYCRSVCDLFLLQTRLQRVLVAIVFANYSYRQSCRNGSQSPMHLHLVLIAHPGGEDCFFSSIG